MRPSFITVLVLSILTGVMLTYSSSSFEHHEGRRMLKYVNPVVDHGNSSFIPGITVFAAVILSSNGKEVHCSDARCPLAINETVVHSRHQLIQSSLPDIPLIPWKFIHAKSCPHHSPHSHKLDRGLSISHMQIWWDFAFFDHDTDEARFRPLKPEYLISNSWSSVSGVFQAFENGTRLKNSLLYLQEDLLLVFEDGVYPAHPFSHTALIADLNTIVDSQNTSRPIDVLLLGNCSTIHEKVNAHHRHTVCPFAYAITRQAAMKLTEYLDICGKRLDQQLAHLALHGLIRIELSYRPHFVIGR